MESVIKHYDGGPNIETLYIAVRVTVVHNSLAMHDLNRLWHSNKPVYYDQNLGSKLLCFEYTSLFLAQKLWLVILRTHSVLDNVSENKLSCYLLILHA
jgi:hypothetical protein